MAVVWLIAGFAVLAAGCIWMKKGLALTVGRKCVPTPVIGLLMMLAGCVSPGAAMAAAAAGAGQSAFTTAMLVGAGVFDVILFCCLFAAVKPFRIYRTVLAREYLFMLAALIWLAAAGQKTFGKGHPYAVLGRGSGCFFLALFAAEVLFLLAGSMKGYRLRRPKSSWPVLPAVLWMGIGCCIMVGGSILTAEAISPAVNQTGMHPCLLGFGAGGLLFGLFYIKGGISECRIGANKVLPTLFGPASLVLTGGLGTACMTADVQLTYTAALLSVLGIALLAVCGLLAFFSKKLGRGGAAVLFVCYGAALVLVFMQYIPDVSL